MKIQRVFLILSIIGIFILILLTQTLSPKTITIKELENLTIRDKSTRIQLSGEVETIRHYNNRVSIYLQDSDIEFIMFTKETVRLDKGQEITLQGTIDFYKNKLQVVVSEIW